MFKKLIAKDSKLILQLLERRGSLTIEELIELTNYQNNYICIVLGWLSKENKIVFSDDTDNEFINIELKRNEKIIS